MQHHNKHSQHKKPVSLRALLNRLKEPLLQPPSLSPINDITMGGRSRSSSSDASDFKSIHNDLSKISSSTGHSDDSESEKNCREFGSDLSSPVPDPDCKTDSPETSQDGTDSDDGNNNTEEIVSDSGQDDDSDGPQNVSFLTLQLSSHLNQTHSLTQELESFRSQEGDLRRKRNAINADLFKVRKRQKIIDAQIEEREDSMRTERNTAGISEVLWDHYEAFCAALEPDGDPVRRSFAWNESYEDSYIKYDPMFGIFGSAVVDLHHCEARNWRCDCVATYTRDGDPIEYHVEYHPLAEFETMIWGDKFPMLYELAMDAAKKGSVAALEMLVALPDSESWCELGWLLEFRLKEPPISDPNMPQRWGFRASHNLLHPITNENKRAKLVRAYSLPFEIEEES